MGQKSQRLVERHPLQYLEAPSRSASAALHAAGLASFVYSFQFLIEYPNTINKSYGWHLQYFTIIGLSLAAITFAFALLADMTLSRTIFRIKNICGVISTPMEVLISILYWSLRTIDPKLVNNPQLPALPTLVDISFHAVPAIVLAVDLLLFSPPWTITFVPASVLSTALAFGYWFWIELCYAHNGFYPYPLFEVLDRQGRVLMFGLSAVIFTASTFGLKKVQKMFHGEERSGQVKG